MSDLVVRGGEAPRGGGPLVKVTPESAGWEYVGFEVLWLARGPKLERHTAERELCVVVLSGRCRLLTPDRDWGDLGGRTTVFDGLPDSVYLPPGTPYRLMCLSEQAEVALASAPAQRGAPALRVAPGDIEVEFRGTGAMEREIRPILMEDRPAERLLVVEVITPNGHWSSYPPHKHDEEALPAESRLEETYYHRLTPTGGFALQRVYSADRSLDDTLSVGDGDVVLVPRGYHAVSAPPGYDLYYLNVMAGPVRTWRVRNDPDHEWLVGGGGT